MPSIRHYAIRIDADDPADERIPAHRSYRSVRADARRARAGAPSLGDRIGAALGLRPRSGAARATA
jgi:hypothetical protein